MHAQTVHTDRQAPERGQRWCLLACAMRRSEGSHRFSSGFWVGLKTLKKKKVLLVVQLFCRRWADVYTTLKKNMFFCDKNMTPGTYSRHRCFHWCVSWYICCSPITTRGRRKGGGDVLRRRLTDVIDTMFNCCWCVWGLSEKDLTSGRLSIKQHDK